MNILDYKIDWSNYSKFEDKTFVEKYFFLFVYILQLTNLPDSFNYRFDEKNNELLDEPGPIQKDDTRINRAINFSIAYLELFCNHDKLLRDIREEFNGLSYNDFLVNREKNVTERLEQVVFNSILYVNNSFFDFKISRFREVKSQFNPDQIDSYLLVEENFLSISKQLTKNIEEPYTKLFDAITNKNKYKAQQRVELDKTQPLKNGINFESFISSTQEYLDYSSIEGIKYNHIQSKVPRTFQIISIFNVQKVLHQLHLLTEALIKLGVYDEMIQCYQIEDTYRSKYFPVRGAQDAVNKYGAWMVERYELLDPGSLSWKIQSLCFKEDINYSKTYLKRASIMRAILRNKLFTKNSNI